MIAPRELSQHRFDNTLKLISKWERTGLLKKLEVDEIGDMACRLERMMCHILKGSHFGKIAGNPRDPLGSINNMLLPLQRRVRWWDITVEDGFFYLNEFKTRVRCKVMTDDITCCWGGLDREVEQVQIWADELKIAGDMLFGTRHSSPIWHDMLDKREKKTSDNPGATVGESSVQMNSRQEASFPGASVPLGAIQDEKSKMMFFNNDSDVPEAIIDNDSDFDFKACKECKGTGWYTGLNEKTRCKSCFITITFERS